MSRWAEQCTILPEAQGGFRKGTGCEDLIFVLHTGIQKYVKEKSNVYALFIDFRRAFPSIKHSLLWKRLLQGEVLSPLLFSLFIHDIEQSLKAECGGGIKLNINLIIHILL